MAFKKTLVQRLFNLSRFSTPTTTRPPTGKPPVKQRRPLYQSAVRSPAPPGFRLFPAEGLSEKLKSIDIARDRIRLDGFVVPYQESGRHAPVVEEVASEEGLTVSDVRKVLRASQAEIIRAKLRGINEEWITYNEYVKICKESCGGNIEQGLGFAKTLDESGSVIVLGNAVCLRPHQEIKTLVATAIHSLVTPTLSDPNNPRRKELEEMEEQKAEIDRKADVLVRRELWAGLGYLVVQTAAFMRLTFWELSWDVMEPICFYVTSAYFMAGYAFFLRTSKEPSFEGFFQSRFSAKQKRLMKAYDFDLQRYTELRKVFYPQDSLALDHHDSKMIKFRDHHQQCD